MIAIFAMAAVLLRRKQGAVIALCVAMVADLLSDGVFAFMQVQGSTYVYYVGLFLVVFGWWMLMSKLGMVAGQIVTGLACAFMSIAVVDCYFAEGYATTVSVAFPWVIMALNAATIWAAWNDRDWTYRAYCNNRPKHTTKNNKADIAC